MGQLQQVLTYPSGVYVAGPYLLGDTVYVDTVNSIVRLPGNITTTKQYLSQTGTGAVSAAPAWAQVAAADIGSGQAMTQVNDTNVTLTLGGTPATALLAAASLTLGWTGQLGLSRGGTNADLSATGGASNVLKQVTAGAAITVGQLGFVDLSSTLAYSQLPTGGGTWANGGTLSITGGVTTVAGLTSSAVVQIPKGTAAAPTLNFTGDTTTGLFWDSSSAIGFSGAGVEFGRVGPGLFEGKSSGQFTFRGNNSGSGYPLEMVHFEGLNNGNSSYLSIFADSASAGHLSFRTAQAGVTAERMRIDLGVQIGAPSGGDLGAGTLNVQNALTVSGLLTASAGLNVTGATTLSGALTNTATTAYVILNNTGTSAGVVWQVGGVTYGQTSVDATNAFNVRKSDFTLFTSWNNSTGLLTHNYALTVSGLLTASGGIGAPLVITGNTGTASVQLTRDAVGLYQLAVTNTSHVYSNYSNGSGNVLVGVNNSSGGAFIGGTAYAATVTSTFNVNLELGTNNSIRLVLKSGDLSPQASTGLTFGATQPWGAATFGSTLTISGLLTANGGINIGGTAQNYGLYLANITVTASGASAYGEFIQVTLASAANNDVLYGLRVLPTRSGAHTGVTQYGIFIDAVTGAATNWALFSNGAAPSQLNGALTVGGLLTASAGITESGGSVSFGDKVTKYNNITTVGWGVPSIYGTGRSTAQTGDVASVATYTVGAADGSFLVSCNMLVTAYTAGTQSIKVDYTDEGGTARTLTLNTSSLGGTIGITVGAAGPAEGLPAQLRCKASTAITIKTVGSIWTGTYNVEGYIMQVG